MGEERKIKTIAEYLEAASAIKNQWPNSILAFRGQENEGWSLASSAERRLRVSSADQDRVTTGLFIEYHHNLLTRCKLKNYHQREGKPLDELELLADLQHHGAATCLIDFTRNALIALWFACERSDAEGKVFVVNTADETAFLEITPADIENRSISDILEFKTRETRKDQADESPTREASSLSINEPNFWYWSPAHLNERITAQHSLFLFGLPSSMESQLKTEKMVIESSSKEQIRQELKELHDIHEESLFPDFIGFAYTQRHNAPYDTPSAEEYLRRGAEALQRGQDLEAIEYCTEAIERKPDYARAYLARGGAYISQGEHASALQDLTKAIELRPDYARAYLARGFAYHRQGEYAPAIQDYTKAIELEPDYAVAYYFRGLVYHSQGKYAPAIQDYTKAVELGLDYADAYYFRGLAYSRQDEHAPAIQDYTKAIELEPDYANAYARRADAYISQGEYAPAIQDATKAIELRPDYADAYATRGNAYARQGQADRAIRDATKAIELKPDYADAYAIRGNAYARQGQADRAIRDATKATELKPDYDMAYLVRGGAYGRKGELDRALQDFTKALELNPNSSQAYYARGIVHLSLGEWQKASDLTAAKSMGLDISASFRRDNNNVAAFEQKIGVKLPEDITAMLAEKPK